MFKSIFITVGTTNFDKLLLFCISDDGIKTFKKIGCEKLTIQCGGTCTESVSNKLTEFKNSDIEITCYKLKDSIIDDIMMADLIISHAGAGTCLEVLHAKKPLIVVVNEELMDNHQTELAEQLASDGHCYYCIISTFKKTIEDFDVQKLVPYQRGNAKALVKRIDQLVGF